MKVVCINPNHPNVDLVIGAEYEVAGIIMPGFDDVDDYHFVRADPAVWPEAAKKRYILCGKDSEWPIGRPLDAGLFYVSEP